MFSIKQTGNFDKTKKYLTSVKRKQYRDILERYAEEGVAALAAATPKKTGKTAASWSYEIMITNTGYRIDWMNSNVVNGCPIAIVLQYGHGTKNGGYVEGIDYINPAIKPIMDSLSTRLWEEVRNS